MAVLSHEQRKTSAGQSWETTDFHTPSMMYPQLGTCQHSWAYGDFHMSHTHATLTARISASVAGSWASKIITINKNNDQGV